MWNKVKAFWNSLPHGVQAAAVAVASVGAATLGKGLENGCLTTACLKLDVRMAVTAAVGVLALYLPNSYNKQQ